MIHPFTHKSMDTKIKKKKKIYKEWAVYRRDLLIQLLQLLALGLTQLLKLLKSFQILAAVHAQGLFQAQSYKW